MTPIMLQNRFFFYFLHGLSLNACVCLLRQGSACTCKKTGESLQGKDDKLWEEDIKRQRQASILFPHRRDWWLHSGFLHTANWIHRSLDKVQEWDCYSLKTEGGENKTRERRLREERVRRGKGGGCERGQYWWGCLVQDQWNPPPPLASAAPPKPSSSPRTEGGWSIICAVGKKIGVGDRNREGWADRKQREWVDVWCVVPTHWSQVACCLFFSIYCEKEMRLHWQKSVMSGGYIFPFVSQRDKSYAQVRFEMFNYNPNQL